IDEALIAQNLTRAADAIGLADLTLVKLASEQALVKASAVLWKSASDPAQVDGPVIQLYLGGVAASPDVIKALTDEITPVGARLRPGGWGRGGRPPRDARTTSTPTARCASSSTASRRAGTSRPIRRPSSPC